MPNRKQHIESIIESIHAIRRKLMASSMAAGAGRYAKAPITPSQWAVLGVVMKKEKVGVKEIAETLGVTSSAATQLIDGLVDNGYLSREGDNMDRRALSLKLSDKHKKKLNEMKTKGMERFIIMFESLNDRELAQYAVLNKKIADSVLNK